MAHTNKIGKEHSHQATSMQSLREEDGFEDKQRTDGVILTLECPRVPYSVVPQVCTQLQLSSGWVEHSNESERAPLK